MQRWLVGIGSGGAGGQSLCHGSGTLIEFPPASPLSFAGEAGVQLTFSELVSAQGPLCWEGWEEETEAGKWEKAGSVFHLLCPP